jgi:hypothetical protein
MRYHELDDHPAKRDNPHFIARLSVYKAEWADMEAICANHGPVQIITVEEVPIIPAFEIEVRCQDARTARALDNAWIAYTETSPHRPHSMEEALAWGEKFNPFPDISREWRF